MGELEFAFHTAYQPDEGGFEVFAGAETVDTEVRTGAGECAFVQVADLRRISHPTAGNDAEFGEDRMLRMEIGDAVLPIAGALDGAEDFFFISAAPIAGSRKWDGGGFFFARDFLETMRDSWSRPYESNPKAELRFLPCHWLRHRVPSARMASLPTADLLALDTTGLKSRLSKLRRYL